VITAPDAANEIRMIRRAVPAESTYTADFKLSLAMRTSNFEQGGVVLSAAGSGGFVAAYLFNDASYYISNWTDPNSFGGVLIGPVAYRFHPRYWRIVRNSATSWDFYVSPDGHAWSLLAAAFNVATYVTPAEIGVQMRANGGTSGQLAIHSFRVR
jgi:hypothetical protein